MPRKTIYPSSEPIFHEPVFAEGGRSIPDPDHFAVKHLSDKATYKQLDASKALQHDVVTFSKSRLPDGEVYSLSQAFGARGADIVKSISDNKRIIFHMAG